MENRKYFNNKTELKRLKNGSIIYLDRYDDSSTCVKVTEGIIIEDELIKWKEIGIITDFIGIDPNHFYIIDNNKSND